MDAVTPEKIAPFVAYIRDELNRNHKEFLATLVSSDFTEAIEKELKETLEKLIASFKHI